MRRSGLKEGCRQPGSLPVTVLIQTTSCSLGGAFSLLPPEAAGFTEWGTGLSKARRQHQLGGSTLQIWARFSRRLPVFSICIQDSQFQESREEMGEAPLPLTSSSITPSESFLSGSHNFLLCWPSWRAQFQGRNASWKLGLPPSHFGPLMPQESTGRGEQLQCWQG